MGGHARTYCRPCSRLSASPAGHTTLLPWLAPQQHTRLRALGPATPAVAVDAEQAKQRSAGALVQHGGEGAGSSVGWGADNRCFFSCASAVLAKVRRNKAAGAGEVSQLCACRGVGGDSPRPWPCRWHARITQRRRVGELEPKTVFLGVGGQFHELVERTKNRRSASRARSGGAPGRAQPVGNAQRARRRLAGLARGTGSGRAKCT